jgi:hypothetical protein
MTSAAYGVGGDSVADALAAGVPLFPFSGRTPYSNRLPGENGKRAAPPVGGFGALLESEVGIGDSGAFPIDRPCSQLHRHDQRSVYSGAIGSNGNLHRSSPQCEKATFDQAEAFIDKLWDLFRFSSLPLIRSIHPRIIGNQKRGGRDAHLNNEIVSSWLPPSTES